MIDLDTSDGRSLLVAIAGSNGAGKSTFFATYLQDSGLPFVNGDLAAPFREAAVFQNASILRLAEPVPDWLRDCVDDASN